METQWPRPRHNSEPNADLLSARRQHMEREARRLRRHRLLEEQAAQLLAANQGMVDPLAEVQLNTDAEDKQDEDCRQTEDQRAVVVPQIWEIDEQVPVEEIELETSSNNSDETAVSSSQQGKK